MHDEIDGVMSEAMKKKQIKAKAENEIKRKEGVIKKAAPKNVVKEAVTEMTAAKNDMLSLLEQMRQKGVKLFVDGETALPGEIASKAVCEGSTYMADYVLGDNGTIEQVRFDKVTGR